jgi:hypothetical protein
MRLDPRIAIPAALVAGALALPASGSADPPSPCPQSFLLVPSAVVNNGAKKDHNGDGLICAKPNGTTFTGGPDDNLPVTLDDSDVVDNVTS